MVKCDKSYCPQCRKILSLSSHFEVKLCEKQEEKRSVRSGENQPTGPNAEQSRGGAAQGGASQESNFFLLTSMLLVMLDFLLQGRQSTDTETVQFGTIIFSPLPVAPLP